MKRPHGVRARRSPPASEEARGGAPEEKTVKKPAKKTAKKAAKKPAPNPETPDE